MEYDQTQSIEVGIASGVLAIYWICFSIIWAHSYYHSHEENMAKSSVPFHLGALVFQLLAIAYFLLNFVYEVLVHDSSVMCDISWLAYSLYLSAAYLVGMSYILGFGTLYVKIPHTEAVILGVTTAVVLMTCLIEFSKSKTARLAEAVLLMIVFLVGLFLGIRTICTITKRIHWSKSEGHDVYAVALVASRRKLGVVFVLMCALLIILVLDESIARITTAVEAKITLWIVFVLAATFVNSWVLQLMKPSRALMDIAIIERHLTGFNRSQEDSLTSSP